MTGSIRSKIIESYKSLHRLLRSLSCSSCCFGCRSRSHCCSRCRSTLALSLTLLLLLALLLLAPLPLPSLTSTCGTAVHFVQKEQSASCFTRQLQSLPLFITTNSRFHQHLSLQSTMEATLRCNKLNGACRAPLVERAVVTTCWLHFCCQFLLHY